MRIDGDKLKQARMLRGLTEFEVSRDAKMAFEHYTNLEEYGGTIRKDAAARLALALDVLVEDIEAEANPKTKRPVPKVEEDLQPAENVQRELAVPTKQPKMPEPELLEPVANTRAHNFFIKFYRRDNLDQEGMEILIRSDVLTCISKDVKYPKIWISYEGRNGINNFSEIYNTQNKRDERWSDIIQALINGRCEFL